MILKIDIADKDSPYLNDLVDLLLDGALDDMGVLEVTQQETGAAPLLGMGDKPVTRITAELRVVGHDETEALTKQVVEKLREILKGRGDITVVIR